MEGLSACECPVCFLLLNSELHLPMSMPCGHTLCKVTMGTGSAYLTIPVVSWASHMAKQGRDEVLSHKGALCHVCPTNHVS